MIRRFKAFCILGVALLALLGLSFRASAATTNTVDVAQTFSPTSLSLLAGDVVIFNIQQYLPHTLAVNGTVIGAGMVPGDKVSYTFSADGTFTVSDSFRGATMSVTVVQPVNIAPNFIQIFPTNHAAILVTNTMTNITLRADAQDEDGSVRRVDFRYGVGTNIVSLTNLIGTVTNSVNTNNTVFSLVWSNALPGRYLFQARVYDNLEVAVNSARFTLNLYTPFTNTLPVLTNSTQYVFTFNADTNLVYVSEYSTNLTNWTPFVTNVATNNIVQVLDPNTNNFTNLFYRVRLLP